MRYSFYSCILFLLFSACNRPQAEDRYHQALEAFRTGQAEQAETLVDQGRKALAPESLEHARLGMLRGLLLLKQPASPERDLLLDNLLVEMEASHFSEIQAGRFLILGRKAWLAGEVHGAEGFFRKADELAEKDGLHVTQAQVLIFEDDLWYGRRDPDEPGLLRAARYARMGGDVYLETKALTRLGFYRLKQNRFDEAIEVLEQVAEGHPWLRGDVFTNLGLCYGRLGYYEKGRTYLNQAVAIFERLQRLPRLQNALGELGNNYYFRGLYREANSYYFKAYQLARDMDDKHSVSLWAGNMADVSIMVGDWGEADQWNEQAISLTEDPRSLKYLSLNKAHIAAGRMEFEAAEAAFQDVILTATHEPSLLWNAHDGLGRLFAERKLWDKANSHFQQAVAIINKTTNLKAAEQRIFYFSRLMGFYRAYVDALVSQSLPEQAFATAQSSRARALMDRFGEDLDHPPSAKDLQERAKKEGVVYLSYWTAPRRSVIWIFSPTGFRMSLAPGEKELAALVTSWQEFLVGQSGDPIGARNPVGPQLYDYLLSEVRDLIPKGARVVIAADGPLWNLNFETLPVMEPTPHYWIEDVTLTMAPSLNLAKTANNSVEPESILLVGDPEQVSPDFPGLEHAASEINNIKNSFSQLKASQMKILTGRDAQPAGYLDSRPQDYDLISFVAHAEANREIPLDSAIILSNSPNKGFKLYARDIMAIPLKAEVVSVSSCTSAGSRTFAGEGLVGFAWAFLHAGAKRVVAGLWEVDDLGAAELMTLFHQRLAAGLSPEEALRASKLDFIHAEGSPYAHKPFYWAAFQIYSR